MHAASSVGFVPLDPPTDITESADVRSARDLRVQAHLNRVDRAIKEAQISMAAIRRELRFPLESVRLEDSDDERPGT